MPSMARQVYLDGSSGEPLLPMAKAAWLAGQDAGWGDPLRLHRQGRLAAQALDQAREVVAAAVGARPDEVVFTTAGALTAQAAVAGVALGRKRIGRKILSSAIEHSSVLAAAEEHGEHLVVGVDGLGRLDEAAWDSIVREPGVALACLQVGNHEVGTLQPYQTAAQSCTAAGVPLILDATAALGRLELTDAGPWAAFTAAAGAFGGPASVGILVLRRQSRWRPPWPVDDYQAGRWPGPLDVPAISAAAAALQSWLLDDGALSARQYELVRHLRHRIAAEIEDVDVAGDPERRLPHLLTFSALYLDGETLTLELDRAGFAVASGSACSARSEQPSHVLAAMGALTHGNLRIGLTRTTTLEEIDRFVDALAAIVDHLRATVGIR